MKISKFKKLIIAIMVLAGVFLFTGRAFADFVWTKPGDITSTFSPTIAGLDGNPENGLEVIAGYANGDIYAWRSNGTLLWGPKRLYTSSIEFSPTVADLNGDGALEIVVAYGSGYLYALDKNGAQIWQEQVSGRAIVTAPAIADLDCNPANGLEIIVGYSNGDLYAWHSNGSLFWSNHVEDRAIVTLPVIADLDADPSNGLEIVLGYGNGELYAWHSDGSLLWGPKHLQGDPIKFSPAIADLDGNISNGLEIIVTYDTSDIYAIDKNGDVLPGWPNLDFGNHIKTSPAIADLDGTPLNGLEVVAGNGAGRFYALRSNGSLLWSVQLGSGSAVSDPAIADLDGDGDLEVVVFYGGGYLYALHGGNGNPVSGWPKQIIGCAITSVLNAPAIADLDNDGKLEVIVGCSNSKIYGWDLPDPATISKPWPMWRGNCRLTGNYSPYFISGYTKEGDGTVIEEVKISIGGYGVVMTKNDGSYKVEDVPSGNYVLSASKSDYVFDPLSCNRGVTTAGVPDINFWTYTISGYIKRYDTSIAVPGMNVNIKKNGSTVYTVPTDASGYYEKKYIGGGTYAIEAANP